MHRTSLILDDESRRAARQLAARYGCSTSEAIRRAVLGHRNTVFGIPANSRQERSASLVRLIELFAGHDPVDELRRLKEQDEGS